MKHCLIIFSFLFTLQYATAQENTFIEKEITINQYTDGTLTLPIDSVDTPLVIFIQGSGPTNRDGNQPMMKNDGIKIIAHQLAKEGISSYRFDKRIFKMDKLKIKEEDLRFEDFVEDANTIVQYFQADDNFSKIILAGHSEGSLIGILSAQNEDVDALISLAGAGRTIDAIIVEQLAKQSAELSENARNAFGEINDTGSTQNYSPYLESIFRPSVQPYIKSWMKYSPANEIAKLDIPVLLINGNFDLQVEVKDAELLKEASPDADLVILERMNHIFRKIEGEELENTKAYNEPRRPLHPELISTITGFINALN